GNHPDRGTKAGRPGEGGDLKLEASHDPCGDRRSIEELPTIPGCEAHPVQSSRAIVGASGQGRQFGTASEAQKYDRN
ncbi:MAG TPA: hypothetical protein DEB46_14210, partial [Myxococcales bacterium]|nr:hypothetical protein [Myxococcales bacterium]